MVEIKFQVLLVMGFGNQEEVSQMILRALSGNPGYAALGRLENTGGMVGAEVISVSRLGFSSVQGLCR